MSAHQSLNGRTGRSGSGRIARSGSTRCGASPTSSLAAPAQLSNEQISAFDDVLAHLIARVETKARAELAGRLAPIAQAPNDFIQRLAHDDEIAVAGPVLTQSPRLSTSDLVSIAQAEEGQVAPPAIAGRPAIEQQVTDVLVNRGNRDVMHTLAGNAGAAFSDTGYSTLVRRSKAMRAWSRSSAGVSTFRCSSFVICCRRPPKRCVRGFSPRSEPEKQDEIRKVLANVSN